MTGNDEHLTLPDGASNTDWDFSNIQNLNEILMDFLQADDSAKINFNELLQKYGFQHEKMRVIGWLERQGVNLHNLQLPKSENHSVEAILTPSQPSNRLNEVLSIFVEMDRAGKRLTFAMIQNQLDELKIYTLFVEDILIELINEGVTIYPSSDTISPCESSLGQDGSVSQTSSELSLSGENPSAIPNLTFPESRKASFLPSPTAMDQPQPQSTATGKATNPAVASAAITSCETTVMSRKSASKVDISMESKTGLTADDSNRNLALSSSLKAVVGLFAILLVFFSLVKWKGNGAVHHSGAQVKVVGQHTLHEEIPLRVQINSINPDKYRFFIKVNYWVKQFLFRDTEVHFSHYSGKKILKATIEDVVGNNELLYVIYLKVEGLKPGEESGYVKHVTITWVQLYDIPDDFLYDVPGIGKSYVKLKNGKIIYPHVTQKKDGGVFAYFEYPVNGDDFVAK